MKKLTPQDIEKWQVDYGEDFYFDGPISDDSWDKLHDMMVYELLTHPEIGNYMDEQYDTVEELLGEPLEGEDDPDEFWNLETVPEILAKILCECAYKTGANILIDIDAYARDSQ